jgi:hypothetical protein
MEGCEAYEAMWEVYWKSVIRTDTEVVPYQEESSGTINTAFVMKFKNGKAEIRGSSPQECVTKLMTKHRELFNKKHSHATPAKRSE